MAEPGGTGDAGNTQPSSRVRLLQNAVIVLFLGYQVGMPLSYYLSDRVYDERFSWRMFSTVRLQECDIDVRESTARDQTEQTVAIGQDLQIAWVNVLKRLRPAVIHKYLERRCDAGASHVTLVGRCVDTDGKPLPPRNFSMSCSDRQLHEAAP